MVLPMELPQAPSVGETPLPSPQFFKVLFPNPFANQLIPHKFHKHLPRELPKQATLSIQNGLFWKVEVYKNDANICFTRGWLEFAKANDLLTGYFLVFRYEGNMVFDVTIFDTSCCIKEYARTPSVMSKTTPCYIEIQDSSESSVRGLSVESHEVKISSNYVNKRKKLSRGKAQKLVEKEKGQTSRRTVQRKKTININSDSEQSLTDSSEGETETTSSSHRRRRKIRNMKAQEKRRKEKKRTFKSIHESTDHRQFEKILSPYALEQNQICIPKQFLLMNRVVGNQTLFLKRKFNGESWPVRIVLGKYDARIFSGWSKFRNENGLKLGDHIIFKFVTKDTLLVLVNVIRLEKNVMNSETSTIVRDYHLRNNYMYISNKFCVENRLTLCRNVILKDLEGNMWPVRYFNNGRESRFNKEGWRKFATENRLKEGDKCMFKLISKDTVLVRVVSAECE